MTLHMNLGKDSYDITVEDHAIEKLASLFNLNRKVLIVTDENIPSEYVKKAAGACLHPVVVTLPAGESTKCFTTLEALCERMLEEGFTRTDAVLALGGGVIGDLAGFAAACFMRGIDFYNVPTTLLSQVDSSIGGKTAIDLKGTKNIIGAFHQPKAVAVDPTLLASLPQRQIANGLAEAIKMAATGDRALFERMEKEEISDILHEVIVGSLRFKRSVVEEDEKEKGLRRVLNFGHTVGHGIETVAGGELYHGECVALGMLYLCSDEVRIRLKKVLKKTGLPVEYEIDAEKVLEAVSHDKKMDQSIIHYVYVPEIGSFELRSEPLEEFAKRIRKESGK